MKRRSLRGMTLVELTTGLGIMVLVVLGGSALLITGLQSFDKTVVTASINNENGQGLRRITESIRGAFSVTISTDGRTLTYVMPRRSATNDPITGEKEIIDPPSGDGVNRTIQFFPTTGRIVDQSSGRVLIEGVSATDPDSRSTLYNKSYPVFQLTTIGSLRAVSINVVVKGAAAGKYRYSRLKTSVVIRNNQ